MSGEEVSYRIAEAWRLHGDRLRFRLRIGLERDEEFRKLLSVYRGSFKSYLESRPASRFYASVAPQYRQSTLDLVTHAMPSVVEQAVGEADRLCNHRVNLLGYRDIRLGKEMDWHRDPVSGHRWPRRFRAAYDLVHDRSADPKIIHELNRHQHLPRLAKAYLLTGDERYAREAVRQMESWIDQNAVWNGVNWQSSLEIAIRSISWMWTIFMLLPSSAFDERAARRIAKSLFLQIDHVHRYPSLYSSPNTHLIGEAAALFIAGLLFPELPRASGWRDRGLSILIKAMEQQVLNDGVYFELSSYYHCYAADFFLQAMVLAKLNRVAIPERVWNRLSLMFDFVMHLTRSDGSLPRLGDDDGGRALALASEHYGSYGDGLCSAAVLFGRPDFKQASGGFREETLWLLGVDAESIYNSLPARASNRLRYSCTDSGYFIQRSGWEASDSHVVFDCGGHGSPSGGHAHADALSLTLFSGGVELLVDPGTSVYNCAPDWRRYFRSTSAHNTVVVDGSDQSVQGGTFGWETKARTKVRRHFSIASLDYVDAEHDGYARLRSPVLHRRRLIHVRPNYWIVLDDLRGRGEHTFDFMYHFAPGTGLFIAGEEQNGEVECRARLNQAGLHMALFASAPVHAEALCGGIAPMQGWISTRYGDRRPAPVFKGSLRTGAPAGAMTFLMPGGAAGFRTRRLSVSGGNALAAAIRDEVYEDICVSAIDPSAELRLMGFSMRGEFFWLRTENGTLRQLLAVNAHSFSAADEVVFRESAPLSHVSVHLWENGMVIERGEEEGKVYVRDLRDRQLQSN